METRIKAASPTRRVLSLAFGAFATLMLIAGCDDFFATKPETQQDKQAKIDQLAKDKAEEAARIEKDKNEQARIREQAQVEVQKEKVEAEKAKLKEQEAATNAAVAAEAERRKAHTAIAKDAIEQILYVQDMRMDNVCFAYMYIVSYDGASHERDTGGPALSVIDCAKIPEAWKLKLYEPKPAK